MSGSIRKISQVAFRITRYECEYTFSLDGDNIRIEKRTYGADTDQDLTIRPKSFREILIK